MCWPPWNSRSHWRMKINILEARGRRRFSCLKYQIGYCSSFNEIFMQIEFSFFYHPCYILLQPKAAILSTHCGADSGSLHHLITFYKLLKVVFYTLCMSWSYKSTLKNEWFYIPFCSPFFLNRGEYEFYIKNKWCIISFKMVCVGFIAFYGLGEKGSKTLLGSKTPLDFKYPFSSFSRTLSYYQAPFFLLFKNPLNYQAPFFLLRKITLNYQAENFKQYIHPVLPTLFVHLTENATTFQRKSLGNKNTELTQ